MLVLFFVCVIIFPLKHAAWRIIKVKNSVAMEVQ